MLRVYHLLIGIVLMVFIPTGVTLVRPHLHNRDNLSSNSINQENDRVSGNIWASILGDTGVPRGWQAIPCDRNSSLLCVSANGKNLGTVAIEIYPLEERSDFQQMLVSAGISPNTSFDNRNPKYQDQVLKALRNWVDTEYGVLSQERQESYGDRIDFAPQPPEVVNFGRLQGIRYGFAGLRQKGKVVEKHLRYVTFDGKAMYVINTAFTTDAIPNKFNKLENLAVFEPYLSAITANLQLAPQDSLVTSQ